MSMIASQITGVSIVCTTVCSGTNQRNHQSSISLAFVRGIHWWPVNSPCKGPVTGKMFPFDNVIMLVMLYVTWVNIGSSNGFCIIQCWLMMNGVLLKSSKTNFTGTALDFDSNNQYEKYTSTVIHLSLRGQWVLLYFKCWSTDMSLSVISTAQFFTTLRPREIGHHFADDTFSGIFLNRNVWISIKN